MKRKLDTANFSLLSTTEKKHHADLKHTSILDSIFHHSKDLFNYIATGLDIRSLLNLSSINKEYFNFFQNKPLWQTQVDKYFPYLKKSKPNEYSTNPKQLFIKEYLVHKRILLTELERLKYNDSSADVYLLSALSGNKSLIEQAPQTIRPLLSLFALSNNHLHCNITALPYEFNFSLEIIFKLTCTKGHKEACYQLVKHAPQNMEIDFWFEGIIGAAIHNQHELAQDLKCNTPSNLNNKRHLYLPYIADIYLALKDQKLQGTIDEQTALKEKVNKMGLVPQNGVLSPIHEIILNEAAKHNWFQLIELFLIGNIRKGELHPSISSVAVRNGYTESVLVLLPYLSEVDKRRLIVEAIKAKQPVIIELLIPQTKIDSKQKLAICKVASEHGDLPVLKRFFSTKWNAEKRTELFKVAQKKNIIQFILNQKGESIDFTCLNGRLREYFERKEIAIIDILIDYIYAYINSKKMSSIDISVTLGFIFCLAANNNMIPIIKKTLSLFSSKISKFDLSTVISNASHRGDLELIKELFNYYSFSDLREELEVALKNASSFGHENIVQYILQISEIQISPNVKMESYNEAAKNGYSNICTLFKIYESLLVSDSSKYEQTPIHLLQSMLESSIQTSLSLINEIFRRTLVNTPIQSQQTLHNSIVPTQQGTTIAVVNNYENLLEDSGNSQLVPQFTYVTQNQIQLNSEIDSAKNQPAFNYRQQF